MRRLIAALSLAALMVAPASEAAEDLDRTWRNGPVYLPDQPNVRVEEVDDLLGHQKTRWPVIIFLHGCRGLSGNLPQLNPIRKQINDAGFAIVAPDSFARPGRPKGCPEREINWSILDMRVEEIEYAVAKVRQMPWADPNNVFLWGQSEGGQAVAMYGGNDVNAMVISGWECPTFWLNSPRERQLSIRADKSIPVLNIKSSNDPVSTYRDTCARFLVGRPEGSRVLDNGAPQHWLLSFPDVLNAMLEFFSKYRKPAP